ncbi:MAG: helix-turn-helix domain-containing protein [Moraxella sp.]|nr:helix-turn-helix domain-containing protein [Moraxella sp.]
MKQYKHLTLEQRYQISALLKSTNSLSEIARQVGVHKSTISREIIRNTGKRGYRPGQANKLACDRKVNNTPRITAFAWAYVAYLLTEKYSPEQINGRLKLLGWQDVPSIESIYQYIYSQLKSQ